MKNYILLVASLSVLFSSCNKCVTTIAEIKNKEATIFNDSLILVGNLPKTHETVKWEVMGDSSAKFVNPYEPIGIFKKGSSSTYSIKYSIIGPCGSSVDTANVSFRFFTNCGDDLVYAGELYPTVKIGNQCWIGKNLNVGKLIIGEQNNNGIIEKGAYNDDPINCDLFGGLYQWGEAMDYKNGASNGLDTLNVSDINQQGICPKGWHLPSYQEWVDLSNYINDSSNAGGKLKDNSGFWWSVPNMGAINSFNFSALPGGLRRQTAPLTPYSYLGIYEGSWFWSATKGSSVAIKGISLRFDSSLILTTGINPWRGASIRCILD